MSKKSNENQSAFPAKVNAMGFEGGLTKLEFMATMITAMQPLDFSKVESEIVQNIAAAKILLNELSKQDAKD